MNAPSAPDLKAPLSQQRIPDNVFAEMRRENLARWPTGKDVDLDEAVALHQALPRHKQLAWVLRRAVAEGRCLTQPRGGFGTFTLQLQLMQTLDQINRKMGSGTLHLAGQGIAQPWRMKTERKSPCYTTRWSEIATAQT